MSIHSKHAAGGNTHISSKAQIGLAAFKESLHKRDASGKFADKPGAGDDAPKKARQGKESPAKTGAKGPHLTPGMISGKSTLQISVSGNPKKGTAGQRFALYKEGMTIDEYASAVEKLGHGKKQALRDIAWDVKQGWIKIGPKKTLAPPSPPTVEAAAPALPKIDAPTTSAAAAAAAAKSPDKPQGGLDNPFPATGFVKVGEKLGSNPGGTYVAPNGDKYYIKTAQSELHAENELLANRLYEAVGTKTLDPSAYMLDGKLSTGAALQKLEKFDPYNPEHIAAARRDFAAHAWVANWDSVGLSYDNLGYVNGKLAMLDAGGALKYRAQGAPKPSFSGTVTEMDTLRSPSNPQAHQVFGKITAAQIADSAKVVTSLSDDAIDSIVAGAVSNPARRAEFSSVLKARRDDIAKRVESIVAAEASSKAIVQNTIDTAAYKKIELPKEALTPAPVTVAPPPAPNVPLPPSVGTKSQVPLAKGLPVAVSTNPDPIPLGAKLPVGSKLHIEVLGNPKISSAAARFALYKDGMSVDDYASALAKAGIGDKSQALKDIAWDLKQGWISASPPGAIEKAAAALGKSTAAPTSAVADQVYNKLTAAAEAPPTLASTKAAVATGVSAGLIAKDTAVIIPPPSPPVKYEGPTSGTTAVDALSKTGQAPPDGTTAVSLKGSGSVGVAQSIKASGALSSVDKTLSPQSNAAGAQIKEVGEAYLRGRDDILVSYIQKGGKVQAAIAVDTDAPNNFAEIIHHGSIKSGASVSLLTDIKNQVAAKGITEIKVHTKAPEFYVNNGFVPTEQKDTYKLDISKEKAAHQAAAAAVGDTSFPGVKSTAPDPIEKIINGINDATLKNLYPELPAGHNMTYAGSVPIIMTTGSKYDMPGLGGAAILDNKTTAGAPTGTQNAHGKLGDADYIKASSQLADKINELKGQGKSAAGFELASTEKAYKVLVQSDLVDHDEGKHLFGLVTNSKGELKGAIAAQTAPGSKVAVITDHAGLGGGSGTPALEKLIASAQAAGKNELLVKSGMTEYYKAQGFSASVDANGFLSLKIDPITYKKPGAAGDLAKGLATPAYGSLSVPSEKLLKQLIKGDGNADTSHVDKSLFKTITVHGEGWGAYNKDTIDKPLTSSEKTQVRSYSVSSAINHHLYNDNHDNLSSYQREHVQELDSAIAKSSFKEDHLLWRAIGKDVEPLFQYMKPGDIFAPKGFNSASVTKGTFGSGQTSSKAYKATMKIYARKGAKGLPMTSMSNHPGESETLIPREAPLRFLGVSPEGWYEFEYK